ncbi:MAG: hypothetical protein NXY57DRAFT_1044132, partial [Lentinula lateritia]
KYAAQQRELLAAGGAATRAGHRQINLGDLDTLQRRLDTRFAQLNTRVELELWQEAFRSIEDIPNLLTTANSMPQIVQPLKTVAGAAATTTPSLVGATAAGAGGSVTAKAASGVGSGAGSAPASSSSVRWGEGRGDWGKSTFPSPSLCPSESSFSYLRISDSVFLYLDFILSEPGSIPICSALIRSHPRRLPPTVQKLYHALEVDFDPWTLCEGVAPLLEELGGGASTVASAENAENKTDEVKEGSTKETTPLLPQALLSRLLTHPSEGYSSIKISFLVDLSAPLNGLNLTEGTAETTSKNKPAIGKLQGEKPNWALIWFS